jgi:hypothetical protein
VRELKSTTLTSLPLKDYFDKLSQYYLPALNSFVLMEPKQRKGGLFSIYGLNHISGKTYKCVRCNLHGKDVLIKNHTRICPYFYCECDKCKELLDIRKLTSRKRRLQPESDQSSDSSSSTISPKTPNIVLNAPNPFFLDNKTGQPPLAPSKIPPYQPVQVQINPVIRPKNTFQLLPNYSSPALLTIQPTLAPINYSNIFVPNNQILDTANNDQFKQMLFFQNLMIANLILNNK